MVKSNQMIVKVWQLISRGLSVCLTLFVLALLLGGSVLPPGDQVERIRAYTRGREFDYVGWMIRALGNKVTQFSLGTSFYLPWERRKEVMYEYLGLVVEIQYLEFQLNDVFANPEIEDPVRASKPILAELERVSQRKADLEPVAEEILESQVAEIAAEMGLTLGGQPVPPVLYHSTPLPLALIVSPREEIRQLADISLLPGIPLDEQIALEDQVDGLGVSSLVVNVGGVGVYPTMVYQTSDLEWLSETVAHEWVHNFLTLRPLGASYLSSPALRTMNETTASIAGKEIGQALFERFYPDLLAEAERGGQQAEAKMVAQERPAFDFTNEMRITRVEVDRLLAEGKVEEAETYMEQRRAVFWEHGYRGIRKLNQAYFAFYGAYADSPGGGAAGEDPVGAAVRALRAQSPTLAAFLNRISWMTSFEQLQEAVYGDIP